MSDEELVPVSLDDDYYYQGPGYMTGRGDYLVPRSRLERWEAAQAAYDEMQQDILRVMDEQRERVRALRAERPKSPMAEFIEQAYAKQMDFALNVPPLLRGLNHQEPE